MKKKNVIIAAAASLMLMSCGTSGLDALGGIIGMQTGAQNSTEAQANATSSVLGGILGAMTNGQTVGNVIQSVIGANKLTQKSLIGTWNYNGPGCAFTSDQLLAQAGGEVVAAQIKQKMLPTFNTLGLTSSNTYVQFKEDGTFAASIDGKAWSGKYTFDASTSKVTMSGLLLNVNCYAKRNSDGIALLFEASKLLTLLQTLSAMSGNSTLQTIGDLSKSYDGLRLGFDMK